MTSLLTLPIRAGLRAAELGLRVSEAVAERAIAALGAVLAPTASPGETASAPHPRAPHSRAGDSERQPSTPTARPQASAPPAPPPRLAAVAPAPPVPEPATPAHISAESTLVRETSDPGAEDGAGAQIHVAEPWPGYRKLKAADVIDRLRGQDTAELAAVELYELSHRGRKTVLDAVRRESRRAQNAP